MIVKGFALPADLPVIVDTVKEIYRFRQRLKHSILDQIMEEVVWQKPKARPAGKAEALRMLKKRYRLVSWYYRVIFRANNPCFVRSLILYKKAKEQGLDVRLVVGLQKNETLEGHGWIEIEGKAFCESAEFLSTYQEMISW